MMQIDTFQFPNKINFWWMLMAIYFSLTQCHRDKLITGRAHAEGVLNRASFGKLKIGKLGT